MGKANARPQGFGGAFSRLSAICFVCVSGAALGQTSSPSPSPSPSALVTPSAQLAAPSIGVVEQLRGAGFAQTSGQLPRIMGKGLALIEGDRLTTADNALAIVKLNDGTKMTLRPGTELVLSRFSFIENNSASAAGAGNDNAMVLQLLRGGLRTLTGLISKSSPNAARIQTSTATIGIRGTDFDARICKAGECAGPSLSAPPTSASPIAASARVLQQQGQISAVDELGKRRTLSTGGSVYPGEIIETASNASALLAFRDESKMNLGASTRLRVDDFSFDADQPGAGRNFVSLLRGSLRAVTGLIGKANRQNVRFSTSTATIGIRGSEAGISCTGKCATDVGETPLETPLVVPTPGSGGGTASNSGLAVFTFDGVLIVTPIVVTPAGQTPSPQEPVELVAGRGIAFSGLLGASGVPQFELLSAPPGLSLPSPAGVAIPPGTFSQTPVADGAEGLFVFVREGHIVLNSAGQQTDLGKNEAGFVGGAQQGMTRLQNIPNHVLLDAVPLPTVGNINIPGLRPQSSTDPVCR